LFLDDSLVDQQMLFIMLVPAIPEIFEELSEDLPQRHHKEPRVAFL
jgi:hypothetical protein